MDTFRLVRSKFIKKSGNVSFFYSKLLQLSIKMFMYMKSFCAFLMRSAIGFSIPKHDWRTEVTS